MISENKRTPGQIKLGIMLSKDSPLISIARYVFIVYCAFFGGISEASAIEQAIINNLGPNKNVTADLFLPDGKGPFPAVLVLHTSGNIQGADMAYARQLAEQGFACLVPHYFDTYDIGYSARSQATTKYAENLLEDFRSEIEFLKTDPRIQAKKTGAVGFSMGGYWALVLAAKNEIDAGVSYYGAISGGGANLDLKYRFRDIITEHSSPVLILHGSEDRTVPVELAEKLSVLLKKRRAPYQIKIYEGAQHNFNRQSTVKDSRAMIKTDTYDAAAADDSWKRTLEFLTKYLK